jgi:predicted dehydrogenase
MRKKTNRREFIQRTALAAGAVAGAMHFGAPMILADSEKEKKLRVAVVGAGGMGGYALGCGLDQNLVALVDVDDNTISSAQKNFRDRHSGQQEPKVYCDYRKMLDECHKELDVVLVSTPDHHHAPAAIRSIQRGIPVFSQKPLAHNIGECRALAVAARSHKVLTQMGNQGHCGEGYRRLVECIRAGAIGTVLETHTIFNRDFGGTDGIPKGKPAPSSLHWNEWLGAAPYREFHDGLHPFSWRSWRKFGTGTLGDLACHCMDGLFWALKLGEVKSYTIECLSQHGGSEEMFTQSNVIMFEFPARGDQPPVKVYTYDNKGQKPQIVTDFEKMAGASVDEGTVYVGDKGFMVTNAYGDGLRILPESRAKEFKLPPRTLPRAHGGPIEDLFWAIRNNGTPCSNFADYSGPFTEMILTGQLAMFAGQGKKLEWDVAGMKCTNHDEVNQFIHRSYRKGWEV